MKWYIETPYGQVWEPYAMSDGTLMFHARGAETDMSDSTIEELLLIFGPLTVKGGRP